MSEDIFAEKVLIRQKYVNNNVGLITNVGDEKINYIRYVDRKGKLKEPRILKLNIGKYPNWNTPDDENSYSESAPLWKTLSKAERLSHIRKLRNEGQTNAKIAKMFNISKSCIEKYVALLSETEKHYKGPKPQNRRDSNEASTDPALTTDHES